MQRSQSHLISLFSTFNFCGKGVFFAFLMHVRLSELHPFQTITSRQSRMVILSAKYQMYILIVESVPLVIS